MLSFLSKDFQVLPGGADINPEIYGKSNFRSNISQYSMATDRQEIEMYKKAVKEGRPIFGICRGMQLTAAMNGLTLIQDLDHPHDHYINIRNLSSQEFDGTKVRTNSCHHQCVWTNNKIEGDNFIVYGTASLSRVHHYQEDEKIFCTVEPEIMWFPEVRALTVQFHPEWFRDGGNYDNCEKYLTELVNKLF
jgi:gamma-glutamyl-gamma-aminobutyrate hydrolase PuuD